MSLKYIRSNQGFVILTQTNGDPGIYADAAARDTYFATANGIIDLARMDANEFIIIKLLDDGGGDVAYQQRAASVFVDVTALIQGEAGPAGATGNSFFFESIAARDAFFNTGTNFNLLMTGLPVIANINTNIATTFYWTGADVPGSYDADLFRPASTGSAPGSLILGEDGTVVSSAARGVNFTDAYDQDYYPLATIYTDSGSTALTQFDFDTFTNTLIAGIDDTVLADPQTLAFPAAPSNTMTKGYSINPATSGEMRVQGFAGHLDTDPCILDVTLTIAPGQVDTIVAFDLPNNVVTFIGDLSSVKFSGVQLNGGFQTSGIFIGTTVPYFEANLSIMTPRNIVVNEDDTLTLKVPAADGVAVVQFLDESDVISGFLSFDDLTSTLGLGTAVGDLDLAATGGRIILDTINSHDILLDADGTLDLRSAVEIALNTQITVPADGLTQIFSSSGASDEVGLIFRDSASAQQASILFREGLSDVQILTNDTFRISSNDEVTIGATNDIIIDTPAGNVTVDAALAVTLTADTGDITLVPTAGDVILDAETVQFLGGSAGYNLEHSADDLHLVSLNGDSILELFTTVGGGTEIARIGLFDVGTSASQVNSERLNIQSNNGEWLINMFATGTGSQRDLKIGSSAGNPVNFVALAAGGTSIGSENGEDVTIASADNILMTPTGNVGINTPAPLADLHISNTSASMRTTGSGSELRIVSSTQTDISNRVTTGVANFDFTNLPLDGISQSNFRFGAQSGSTGTNSLQLFDPNGSTIQTLFRSSGGDSYINSQGGMLAIGATLAETLFHITNTDPDTTPIQQWETTGTNGGSVERFVGDRDPNGNVTGMGGDEYFRDSGTTSSWFMNKASTTDTVWRENSLQSEGALEVWSLDDLPTAVSDVITLPSGLYKFMAPINFGTTTLDTTGNSVQMYAENSFVNSLTYEGTGTFITATDTSGVRVFYPGITFILSGDGATFCDIVGSIGIQFSSILFTHANGGHLGTVTGRDTGALTSSRFIMTRTVVRQWLTGFNISDTSRSYCNTLNIFSHDNASSGFINLVDADALMFIVNVEVEINNVNASFVNIDPTNPNPVYLNNNFLTGVGPFFQQGVTGTFTAVVDNSLAATTINSVSDNGGDALFSTGAAVPIVGQTIVISGFVTNTDYNGTFICTNVGPGVFGAADFGGTAIPFGTTETGSVIGDGVTVTSATHGLLDDQTLTMSCDLSTEYDNGFKIYNVQTNSFDINAPFGATQTGSWDTSSQDSTSPGVTTFTNTGTPDSKHIACAYVNDNAEPNGTIVNNTFTDMVFGTVGDALIQCANTERWKLVDELNGTFEYTGDDPFDGTMTYNFSVASSGGAVEFRFKWVKDTGGGFADLTDDVQALAEVGGTASSVSKTMPLTAATGDLIKPQITRNSGTSSITSRYVSIDATQ